MKPRLGLAVLAIAVLGAVGSALAVGSAPTPLTLALRSSSADVAGGAGVPDAGSPDWPRDDWDWIDRAPVEPAQAGLSPWKAVAASALLPGLGQRYANRPERARLFFVVEGAIWSVFAFYRVQGDIRQDRQLEFANTNAGAPEDQDSDYYEHIGLWLSIDEWHDVVRQDARLRYPDDPAAQEAFFEQNKRYDEGQAWAWSDDATRIEYRQLRSRTERSYRNSRLAAGAALFNRFASMIDALALTRSHNRNLREEHSRLELRVGPAMTVDGLVIGPVVTTRY